MSRYCSPLLSPFPPLSTANEDGLLAVGGDLSPERLLCAYSEGIFPWFSKGQQIMWWSPDPRCVLFPARFKTHRSLVKSIRARGYQVTIDRDFPKVIAACAAPRRGVDDTWITDEMQSAYIRLHHLGTAHSVEVWQGERLVGGLYGVALGSTFFGESMFSLEADASKTALKALCERVDGLRLIDCQLPSAHLSSLGAELIPRQAFVSRMQHGLDESARFPDGSRMKFAENSGEMQG